MIKLTHPEKHLREIFLAAANTFPRSEQAEPLIVRFAGGWVRDKLLNCDSDDIDVALSIATGVQFAAHVKEFVRVNKLEHEGREFGFQTILQNVEQSKHLEIARANYLGLSLDFVNLRSEEYADHSRIPEKMRFGTPKEDAERRDLTINSLFYNIHTEQVEDFTGMGLDDMRNGIIRTPLDPLKTFMDDPLRVLRTIRFAARLDFQITAQVKAAILDPLVKVCH